MIKDILVHVDGSAGGNRRLSYTMALARQYRAHVTALHVTPPADAPAVFKPSMVEQVSEAIEVQNTFDAHRAKAFFEGTVDAFGTSASWIALTGDLAPQVCQIARTSDLVIVGQYEWQRPAERHPLSLAESVALASGRPVLVVPAAIQVPHLQRALVAWDGGPEAARALHDALPLLRLTRAVELATINMSATPDALRPLIEHLRRHEIPVQDQIHIREVGGTADLLLARLKEGQFDLLVMGAYGRPAWLEFLFGGTTPSMLLHTIVPVLLSH